MTTQITVIGLDQIGASIGLALADYKDHILRVGHDPDSAKMKRLEKESAFDKTFTKLSESVHDADVVILALPVDLVKDTLTIISSELKPGTVVINTSLIRSGISEWVSQILPSEVHYISMMPVLNPDYLEERGEKLLIPHSDLFEKSEVVITSGFSTNHKAIQTAADLAVLLKTKTLFADPIEADGVIAAVEQLPRLAAAALVHMLIDRPGWKDSRRFTTKGFFRAGSMVELTDEQEFFGISLLMNKDNVTRSIGELISSLEELREMISENDEDGLKNYLKSTKAGYGAWFEERKSGGWETIKREELPISRNIGERLFGGLFSLKNKK